MTEGMEFGSVMFDLFGLLFVVFTLINMPDEYGRTKGRVKSTIPPGTTKAKSQT